MGWKQWLAIGVVIGGGILLQIPKDHSSRMDRAAEEHAAMNGTAEAEGPYATVALEVMGMT